MWMSSDRSYRFVWFSAKPLELRTESSQKQIDAGLKANVTPMSTSYLMIKYTREPKLGLCARNVSKSYSKAAINCSNVCIRCRARAETEITGN
jgi:hypothetical protein